MSCMDGGGATTGKEMEEEEEEQQRIEWVKIEKCAEEKGELEQINRIEPKSFAGLSMAVFTSGGDSSGMNSAIRSVIRTGLYFGCRVFCIKEGLQGMVDGGENIKEADWDFVSDIIHLGGTVIGSARCKQFFERSGRLKACKNLVLNGITNLVCIGGDGSLTGMDKFRGEWPSLVSELLSNGEIDEWQAMKCCNVQIVGLVGSIDNDFCGTDMTIGTDTALHRITEAIDAVVSTAQSHHRAFVIEVMGRHCGYLALTAALASEADFCFIPEWPQPKNWEEVLCKKLKNSRELNQTLNIIVVAEGAIDRQGEPITSNLVAQVVKTRLGYDTKVTVLGHVQRGGNPSAFDRILGCRAGAEATLALLEMTPEAKPFVIAIDNNQMVRVPLMECVQRTHEVQKAMDSMDFERAVQLRGGNFQRNLTNYQLLTKLQTPIKIAHNRLQTADTFAYNLAVIIVGAPAGGINAVVRAFVRVAIYHRCKVFGINNCFQGMAEGRIEELSWESVAGWGRLGGAKLGTQRQLPNEFLERIAVQIKCHNIQALLIIGGFQAFHSALILSQNRGKFPEFSIPICVVPASISNNVPGTLLSVGSDTALNMICQMLDNIKQSASGTSRRVFLIETMGGFCGYLATFAALASAADNAYTFEEPFSVDDLKNDVKVIAAKMETGFQRYLIMKSEGASANYDLDFMSRIFKEEGKGKFSTRANTLGHAQEGGKPSPFDRDLGAKFGIRSLEWFLKQLESGNGNASVLIGLDERGASCSEDGAVIFTPLKELVPQADFEHCLPKQQWWRKVHPLLRMLAKHETSSLQSAALMDG